MCSCQLKRNMQCGMGSVCGFGAKMYADCVPFALGGCSEVAVATSNKASRCPGVAESRREGEVGEREGPIRGEVG